MSLFIKITDRFSVASQLSPEAMEQAAKEGFHTVMCNRPDDEEANQPTLDKMAKAATRSGLAFHAVPFDMTSLDRGIIASFEAAIETADGPVLAYCRSGTRCTIAWCVTQRRAGESMANVLATARAAGYELTAQTEIIEALI